MFVVTSAGVIATDPIGYGRPQAVVTYVDEIKKVSSQPIKYLIYSHHHFDHIAGGKPFKDAGATIVAHKRAKERLAILKDPHTVLPDETVDAKRTSAGTASRRSLSCRSTRAGPDTSKTSRSSCGATAPSGGAGPEVTP